MNGRLLIGGAILVCAALLGGCVTTTTGLGDDRGPVRLPPGVSLLESGEDACDGALQISAESVVGRELYDDQFVDPGQNATYRLEDDDVKWACIERDDRDFDAFECPGRATHVRITRAIAGGALLVECYG